MSSVETYAELATGIAGILRGSRHVDDPDREARELVAALLDVPRHWPALHGSDAVGQEVPERALVAARKRAAGAPLAYAVGKANFRQLTLAVDERVLIPRPETELLVELVLARCASGVAVDVGTGSGAIALSLAAEGRFDRVIATDVSRDALEVAAANARSAGLAVELVASDLLAAIPLDPIDLVVSNPPYIAFEEAAVLPRSVRDWEPALALFSPDSGLAATRRLVRQAARRLRPSCLLALEVDERRASLVAELVSGDNRFEDVTVHLDLAGRERFVLATRRKGESA
jgi:release factor glutamine methyltransferase